MESKIVVQTVVSTTYYVRVVIDKTQVKFMNSQYFLNLVNEIK